ncbi:MAG: DUF192 domain-containing protein [Bacteroidales bacterium]
MSRFADLCSDQPARNGWHAVYHDREEPVILDEKHLYFADIIYVDSRFEIVTIQKYTQPLSEESIPSGKMAKYMVEVNAGFCDRFGIMEGDKIKFQPNLKPFNLLNKLF